MSVGTTKRKSIALSQDEFSSLKQYASKFNTGVECAESIGIHRNVLDRILLAGSGSPESIEKVRTAISNSKVVAKKV